MITAFTGATVIDAVGEPRPAGVVLVEDGLILAAGAAQAVPVPSKAEVIDLTGKFLLPGFIDGNVHLVPWPSWTYIEFLARYEDRMHEVAIEAAQIALAAGFTTVFDSMGPLDSLIEARSEIESGRVPGARMFVAGDIVGFRAVFTTVASMASASTAFQKRINDRFEAGAGPELSWMSPSQIFDVMTRYAESGVDFVKYGATGDGAPLNSEIGQDAVLRFSPDQQRAIVDAVHAAGLTVQTHTTSAESLHIAVEVGNDMGQHAAHTGASRIYDSTIERMLERGYSCGTQWGPLTEDERRMIALRKFPGADRVGRDDVDFSLENAVRLIEAGVPQLVTTDAGTIDADVALDVRQWGGLGGKASLIGEAEFQNIQGMADRGMSPMQIIQAATINVARAYRVNDRVGSIEPGKVADLVVLDRDPLIDSAHLRSVSRVIQSGRVIDRGSLPTRRVLTVDETDNSGRYPIRRTRGTA